MNAVDKDFPDYFAAGMEHVAGPVLGLFVIRRRSGICYFIFFAVLDINDHRASSRKEGMIDKFSQTKARDF